MDKIQPARNLRISQRGRQRARADSALSSLGVVSTNGLLLSSALHLQVCTFRLLYIAMSRQKNSLFSFSPSRLFTAILLVLAGVYYAAPLVLANSGTNDDSCKERRPSGETPAAAASGENAHYCLSAGYAPEEKLLSQAFNYLRQQDLNAAVACLQELNREFPDNEDYALLLKMGQRRQGAQQWYRYQEWVERKQKFSKPYVDLSQRLTRASEPGRINELKRATWLILATGKNH